MIQDRLHDGQPVTEIRDKLRRLKSKVKWPLHEMILEDGLLYRQRTNVYGEEQRAVCLPSADIEKALMLSHSSPTDGHGVINVSLAKCQSFATWPSMKQDVEYVKRYARHVLSI